MPLLLRTIALDNWLDCEKSPWLKKGDIPADPLSDLTTKGNELSVWAVNEDKSNLEQVLLAVAIARQALHDTGFVLFNAEDLVSLDIALCHSPEHGRTWDAAVNSLHHDLVELSGAKVLGLASFLIAKGDRDEVPKEQLVELLDQAIASGRIEEASLNSEKKDQLKKYRQLVQARQKTPTTGQSS